MENDSQRSRILMSLFVKYFFAIHIYDDKLNKNSITIFVFLIFSKSTYIMGF